MSPTLSLPGEVLAARVKYPLTPQERELLLQIVPERLPRHIAIIMDGNGRWARQAGFRDRIRGHEAGIDSVRTAVRACGELHLRALTLYAFSVENWQRPKKEVDALMRLLIRFLNEEIPELNENNVRLVASGRTQDLSDECRRALDNTMAVTAGNTGLVLNLALSYGGRTEIIEAVRQIATEALAGTLDPVSLTEEAFSARLYHPELGDPDLLVRTSGEFRVSNFLLWQIAYTEIYVTPTLWPDFRRAHLYEAILDYEKRERRFGKVLEKPS
ncbi:MAG: isoprenyl transferase [Candidatus Sumerlaeaceae bacterium]|nr:isoprenyl transferase [Candidatus Sumerlaeaceae bacterium]